MPSPTEKLPQRLGRYQIRERLRSDALGELLVGYDPALEREVTIRWAPPDANLAWAGEEAGRVLHIAGREAMALEHPGIAEVFDYSDLDAGQPFIAGEPLPVPPLCEALTSGASFSAEQVAALGHQLLAALEHAHAAGIVHGAIDADQVYWRENGRVSLAGFGFAEFTVDRAAPTPTAPVTTEVDARAKQGDADHPRQADDGEAADLMAVGKLLQQMLEIADPGAAERGQGEPGEGRSLPATPTEAAAGLSDTINALCGEHPQRRIDTASQALLTFRRELDRFEVVDPRDPLRRTDEDGRIEAEGEDDEPKELFVDREAGGIHARRSPIIEARARLSSMMNRGPVALGMLGVALFLGAGAYMFMELGELPDRPRLFGGAVVTTDPEQTISTAASDDIYVLLQFPGEAVVVVDDEELGSWHGQLRLALPPGRHRFEVRFAAGPSQREVDLSAGSSPTLQFSPPPGDD